MVRLNCNRWQCGMPRTCNWRHGLGVVHQKLIFSKLSTRRLVLAGGFAQHGGAFNHAEGSSLSVVADRDDQFGRTGLRLC